MEPIDFQQYSDDLSQIDVFPDGKIFRLTFDANIRKMKIICNRYQLFEDLRNAFSAANGAAFFAKQYGYSAAARVYAINKFGYFNLGLTFEILQYIKDQYGSLNVLAISKNCKTYLEHFLTPLKQFILDHSGESMLVSNISEDVGRNNELKNNGKTPYEFRDYQKNSIDYLINKGYGRGLIEIPTAGGKSFILANFIWNILKNVNRHYKTLILVPNKQLVEQFYKDLLDYGYNKYEVTRFTAGLKGANAFNPDAKIIIANRQYVFNNKDKLPDVDILICDEVHQCTAAATEEYIENLNCRIKIGCSGTLPRDKFNKWKLVGMFSRIVYTEDIVKLQQAGYISKLKITQLNIIDSVVENDRNCLFNLNSLRKYRPDETGYSEIAFNAAHDAEHEYYAKHFDEIYRPVLEYIRQYQNVNVLVLFDSLEVGRNIFELFKTTNPTFRVFYNDGSTPVEERETVRQKLENTDGNFLFANVQIMSTGINIKRLHKIVFCFNSKSTSRIIQSIGRILRLYQDKDYAELIDCNFNYKYSQKHFKERLQLYKEFYNKSKCDNVVTFRI